MPKYEIDGATLRADYDPFAIQDQPRTITNAETAGKSRPFQCIRASLNFI
jgi:hypothetical protein